ncbi:MAG: carbohydrate binding domain-containing protein [Muribaculaceae bacterium]|nr:carbohydrate binding domain-containing protein [Muribaculaceae bacterium]
MKSLILTTAFSFASLLVSASTFNLNLDFTKDGAPIQPTMYGLFYEDINYAGDGGLYAELIKNRSFEFPQNLLGWTAYGKVDVLDDGPFERNPHYVRLSYSGHKEKHTGLQNEGYMGIGVEKGEKYRFSVWARVPDNKNADIRVIIADPKSMDESHDLASATISVDSQEWEKYTVELEPYKTVENAVLRIFLVKPEPDTQVDLEHISLFPANTWKGHENGLRNDIVELFADIQPGVFRFPGGCIVEGTDLATRYQWKNTIGPVENRPLNENRWHYTFAHRFFPDYFQSNGLGFYEYFQLAEEIGAEPLPVVSVGLACQYQNDDPSAHVPVDSLDSYIQDALDLIEFANGPATSQWGKKRAEMGHPEPFNLKYLAIGNEQWGPEYVERLERFITPIRQAYPEIQIIGSSGPDSEGQQFNYLWPEMKRLQVDLVDEHFYRPEDWFLAQGTRYDDYDREGPKVFAGEYACHMRGRKYNHFMPALLEAAFMTGLERNADVVYMATYAPLLAHKDGWQWRPDMIWFDNLTAVPSSNYYVQKLYANNKGTNMLPLRLSNGAPLAGLPGQDGMFASAVWDNATNQIILKIANTSSTPNDVNIDISGLSNGLSLNNGSAITLSAGPEDQNTFENPDKVVPVEKNIEASGSKFQAQIPPLSFIVYKLNLK